MHAVTLNVLAAECLQSLQNLTKHAASHEQVGNQKRDLQLHCFMTIQIRKADNTGYLSHEKHANSLWDV